MLTGLQPDRRYDFDLSFVRAGVEVPLPDASGSFRTYPPEGSLGRFTFAFGSCANPDEQSSQGSWTAIRSLARSSSPDLDLVRLFVHLGDTFYFYDHMTEEKPRNVESMHAAHVSMRRHPEFLDMARDVPCCGVWDDHDFAGDNTESTDFSSSELLSAAKATWLQYWGNNQPISETDFGLTTRISCGLVDIYLLDGRIFRDASHGVCFGRSMIEALLHLIDARGRQLPRVVVLATGSNWNHNAHGAENYGDDAYTEEREEFFQALARRMGSTIFGLILLSGDDHINEIFHVKLDDAGRIAPEFVSSPLTRNSDLKDDPNDLGGERVASFPSGGAEGKRGFTTLTIDASNAIPDGNWTAVVRYYQESAAAAYDTRTYTNRNGQFVPS